MPTLTLTPAVADAIAEAVASGVPLETAAVAAGITRTTVYAWLHASQTDIWPSTHTPVDPASKPLLKRFSEQIQRARAEWEAKQIRGIMEAAEERNEKTGQRDWRARAWLLNNHPATREMYHEHKTATVETRQTVSHVFQAVSQLPDHELDALEQQLHALPPPNASSSGAGD